MAFIIFVGVMALLVLAERAASGIRRWRLPPPSGDGRRLPTAQPVGASVADPPVGADGEREESRLVARLLAGEISPARYRRAMADLARQDALRHPVVVPPDQGP